MRRVARENALCATMAAAGCAALAWLGLYGYAWSDYEVEAKPAYEALLAGHVADFLRLAPAYGGSLVERAPFALLADLWGGGQLAVYRLVALPCLLAAAVLGVWLTARMRHRGYAPLARATALGVCVVNPVTLRALELGHPEELLGGCLCVAAVLLVCPVAGGRAHPAWAGVLLGLAIANKPWALLAAGPVLLATEPRMRATSASLALATCALVLAPLVLVGSGGFVSNNVAAASTGGTAIFQPWQLWWFFGSHGATVHGLFGAPKPGYRDAVSWANTLSHPLIITVGFTIALALWLRHRRAAVDEREALLALALVLALRCLLDTWDAVYYTLPLLLALLAWELSGPSRRMPLLAPACSVLVWVSFQWLPERASADMQALAFLLWFVPLTAWLGMRLLARQRSRSGDHAQLARQAGEHLTAPVADHRQLLDAHA